RELVRKLLPHRHAARREHSEQGRVREGAKRQTPFQRRSVLILGWPYFASPLSREREDEQFRLEVFPAEGIHPGNGFLCDFGILFCPQRNAVARVRNLFRFLLSTSAVGALAILATEPKSANAQSSATSVANSSAQISPSKTNDHCTIL